MRTRAKIVLLAACTAALVGLALGGYMVKLNADATRHRIADLDRALRADFDRNARLQVEQAVSMLQQIADRATRGEVSQADARAMGADFLRKLRYDKDGYFWADDYAGVNVVLLGRADEGKSRIDKPDAKGKCWVRDFLSHGRSGGGYTDYYMVRKEGGQQFPKRAYTLAFEPFGWVVGTGNYVDDIDAAVAKERVVAEQEARGRVPVIVGIVLLTTLLAAALATWLARSVTRPLGILVEEATGLRRAVADGRLDARGDAGRVGPEFRPVIDGLNETIDALVKPIRATSAHVARIARGDLPPPITADQHGEFEAVNTSLNGCVGALRGLIADTNAMSAAHDAGDIEAAIDASRFQGAWAEMANGVNAMVAGHVTLNRKAMACVAEFGKGNFAAPLERFPGKKAFINQTVEQVRSNLEALIADAVALSEAAVEGKLDVRADAARHPGDFRRIVQGVNDALDSIVTPFRVIADYCERISHGDIPPRRTTEVRGEVVAMQASLNRCIDSVHAMVDDTNALVEAAVAGELVTRADPARHEGDFRKIVAGMNSTLDAVLGPIQEAAGVLDRLAQRDLRARVKGEYRGDHAKIKEALNATAAALHDALAQVSEAVSQVSSAAGQIAASSQAVADGASEQASSLEETSASLESMATMTKQAADSAQQANGLARTARGAAAEGGAAMEQMSVAMARIKASSAGTSQIIKDINEIAFQTNLLALNAAVEAARAGEAGRGFAVVAEEVRSLALRSKEAANKTEELIRQSVKEAAEGEVRAKHVHEKLQEIAGSVGKVTDIVAEIAASAKEQAAGIDQVNKAVAQMDQVTQQNAASSEESSSAAAELSGQSEELAAMVGAFALDRAAKPASRATASQRRRAVRAEASGLPATPAPGALSPPVSGPATRA